MRLLGIEPVAGNAATRPAMPCKSGAAILAVGMWRHSFSNFWNSVSPSAANPSDGWAEPERPPSVWPGFVCMDTGAADESAGVFVWDNDGDGMFP